ncbi:MAG: DUF4434 domain-containing protein [Fibrobacter sp.]|uniref:DUF4434 domain-containing protein n=1 Tax=Fibrobacter sp. TaxID=35828 RepID=UPI0025BF6488|nr:DUF4434 domain-containing protein [Fibrobacter sp.]MBQ3713963.1 DUF4434 domain-containing protein [Fibrobacter sp.]MBQ7080355.1 DUF4434 domain-containing protein [Fibrobacter sp.]
MASSLHLLQSTLPALLWGGFVLAAGPFAGEVHAAGVAGVFDAGWTTAYQSQDSITHMHQRLHALGMDEVVLQYAAVEATHLYYPSQLDFLQNTQYKNNELFPKSIEAAKAASTRIWLGLYYNGENWYTPPTAEQLDTLTSRNQKVLEEVHSLYGNEGVIEGVYIPQEIARYYWDGLRDDATPEMLTEHFLKPVTEAAQAKGWKVMAAPFYNQNLETPEKLQSFFEKLFAAGFKPDIIAVQDGVGASDAGKAHAETATVGNYERSVADACKQYGIEFWIDMELFRTDNSQALADSARISAQLDTAYAAGAVKVIGYDLAVLGNAGLDSLEKWKLESSVEPTTRIVHRKNRETRRASNARDKKTQKRELFLNGRLQNNRPLDENSQYFKTNGAQVK